MASIFKHGDHLVQAEYIQTGLMGPDSALPVDSDVGGPVKRIADSSYGLTADGDEFCGILTSLEQGPTDGGLKVGGYWSGGGASTKRVACSGTIAIDDLVVADGAGGVKQGTPLIHRWQVVAIESATKCVIQRV